MPPLLTRPVAGVSSFTLTVTSATAQDVRLGTAWLVNNLSSFSDTTLTFSNVFGDHMLFQRNKPINIWGKAARGDTVTATLTETASGKVAASRHRDRGAGRHLHCDAARYGGVLHGVHPDD